MLLDDLFVPEGILGKSTRDTPAIELALQPVGRKDGQQITIGVYGSSVALHLCIIEQIPLVDPVTPVDPLLLEEEVILPCFVVLRLQIRQGFLHALMIDHLLPIEAVRNNRGHKGLVLIVPFLLHTEEVCSTENKRLQVNPIGIVLKCSRIDSELPTIINQCLRHSDNKVEINYAVALSNILQPLLDHHSL